MVSAIRPAKLSREAVEDVDETEEVELLREWLGVKDFEDDAVLDRLREPVGLVGDDEEEEEDPDNMALMALRLGILFVLFVWGRGSLV